MAILSEREMLLLKQKFEDAGRGDEDTTMSDLEELVDEVLANKRISDEWYVETERIIKSLEREDGVKYSERQK